MTEQLSNGQLLCQQQDIKVYENGLYRWLCFKDEQAIQSCMSLSEPDKLHLAYQQFMMVWQLFFSGAVSSACVLGLGGGDIVRYLANKFPAMMLLVVEKDPIVAKIATEYFLIQPTQACLTIEIADAENFVQNQQQHDLMLIDIVVDNQLPKFLYTENFWKHCRQCLSNKGMVIMNVIPESEKVLLNLLTVLKNVFGRVPLCMGVPDHKNIVLLLSSSTEKLPSFSELKRRCKLLQHKSELPFYKYVEILGKDNKELLI